MTDRYYTYDEIQSLTLQQRKHLTENWKLYKRSRGTAKEMLMNMELFARQLDDSITKYMEQLRKSELVLGNLTDRLSIILDFIDMKNSQ